MKTTQLLALVTIIAAFPGCCFGGTSTDTATDPFAATDLAPAPGSPSRASCDVVASISTCRDMGRGAFALGEDLMRSLCTGTYTSEGICPTEGRVGTCDEGGGTLRRYYSTGGMTFTTETAQTDCTAMPGATFTAN